MLYTQHTIAGITVILAPMAEANSTTVEVLVKAGSIYETKQTNGISHFLEHMFFKGGKKFPSAKAVAVALDAVGAECNAFTSGEYAGYYVKSAPQYTKLGLEVLADLMLDAAFPLEEIEREKGVVVQEIAMYEDSPQQDIFDKRQRRYYGDNSYGWNTLGPAENVLSFTQQDLKDHKQALYTKDNLIIVVAGRIDDTDNVLQHIAELFADLPETKQYNKPEFSLHIPAQHEAYEDRATKQNHLIISAQGYDMHQSEKYAAKLLGIILGGPMSSRLFQQVREEKGLCYYIHASHHASDSDGLFYINAGMEKARREEGLASIRSVLKDISSGDILTQEREKALGNITGKTQMGIETSNRLANFLGMQYLFKGKIETLEETLAHYREVTLADLQSVAKNLAEENLYAYRIQ